MPTINQLIKKTPRRVKEKKKKSKFLQGNPQRKGICIKLALMSPFKPNSAKRKVARVETLDGKQAWIYIPGEGNHMLQLFSNILIRGGRVRDLPVRHRAIRNKYDLKYVAARKSSRSKYGKFKEKRKWKLTKLKKRF